MSCRKRTDAEDLHRGRASLRLRSAPILPFMTSQNLQPFEATEWMPAADSSSAASLLRIAWGIPVILAGAAGWIAGGLAWSTTAAAAVAIALWGWVRLQGRLVLRSLNAVRLRPEQAPRLFNIAEGLAGRTGGRVPAMWLIPGDGPNALVCWAGGPALAVSQSLLDGYTRTELEAVVAHCFVRLPHSAARSEALALGRLGIAIAASDGLSADAAAAALTRYPPALASAIAKAQPRSDRFALLWFVSSRSAQADPQSRAEMLLDL